MTGKLTKQRIKQQINLTTSPEQDLLASAPSDVSWGRFVGDNDDAVALDNDELLACLVGEAVAALFPGGLEEDERSCEEVAAASLRLGRLSKALCMSSKPERVNTWQQKCYQCCHAIVRSLNSEADYNSCTDNFSPTHRLCESAETCISSWELFQLLFVVWSWTAFGASCVPNFIGLPAKIHSRLQSNLQVWVKLIPGPTL